MATNCEGIETVSNILRHSGRDPAFRYATDKHFLEVVKYTAYSLTQN